ncbi:MAG: hypothetical protein E7252_04225 [Lachnospira sp.]|nr:hypothetical protein [Lachnospira sp.]
MGKRMRKIAIYMAMLLWVIAIFNKENANGSEGTIVKALSTNNLYTEYSQINVFSEYNAQYLSLDKKQKIIEDCAKKLGLSNYTLESKKEGQRVSSILVKKGKNAISTIKFITIEEKGEDGIVEPVNYLMVDLLFYKDSDSMYHYKDVVESMFTDLKLKPQISTSIVSSASGIKTLEEKSAMADAILKDVDAKIVSQNRSDEIFTIYAYSKEIDEYIVNLGKKVNVNIAISYDETSDKTFIYYATPIYNTDY